jgi:hypothetical protein
MQPGEDARPDIGDISHAKEANKYLPGVLFVDIMMIIHTVLEESPIF